MSGEEPMNEGVRRPGTFSPTAPAATTLSTVGHGGKPLPLTAERLAALNNENFFLLFNETGHSAEELLGLAGRSTVNMWEQMYGEVFDLQDQWEFKTTERMRAWLDTLEHRPSADQILGMERTHAVDSEGHQNTIVRNVPRDSASIAAQGTEEDAPLFRGTKRRIDDTSNDLPPSKRVRTLGSIVKRTFAKLNGSVTVDNGKKLAIVESAAAATTSQGKQASFRNKITESPIIQKISTKDTSKANDDHTLDRLVTSSGHSLSRLSILEPTQPAPTSFSPVSKTVKICLVGDSNAGKTAFFHTITDTTRCVGETVPSITVDCKAFASLIGEHGRIVPVELYDFPGVTTIQRRQQLVSNFFHAAVVCYSIENRVNVDSVLQIWKPLLDNALIECPVFVVGLKSDTRPQHPTVQLGFDPKPEPVSEEMGLTTARLVSASGFAECSALSPASVAYVWRGILSEVVAGLERGEYEFGRAARSMTSRRRLGQGLAAVAGVWRSLGGRGGRTWGGKGGRA